MQWLTVSLIGMTMKSNYFFYKRKRMERRSWTPYEDQILKNLYEKVKLNKWSLIAKQMQEDFNMPPRTGKQCRERYNNHLNPFFAKSEWTLEEEQQLFRLHNQLGNKWAIIASRLGGRTDNGVKNHFFAKLRKSMRRINKLIQEKYRKELKEIKANVLYKIVEASEQRFKKNPLCQSQTSEFSCYLKNQILKYAHERPVSQEICQFSQLISQIFEFGKKYKRKPKQLRRLPEKNQLFPDQFLPDQSQLSQANSELSDKEDSEDEILRTEIKSEPLVSLSKEDEKELKRKLRSETIKVTPLQIQETNKNQPQSIFKGILVDEQENEINFHAPFLIKKNTSSEALGEAARNAEQFFQESDMNFRIPPVLYLATDLKKSNCQEQIFNLQIDGQYKLF